MSLCSRFWRRLTNKPTLLSGRPLRVGRKGAVHKEASSMSSNVKRILAAWMSMILIAASLVLVACGSSEPADVVEGPGMLYFYAEW
jgi:hypothetical protein